MKRRSFLSLPLLALVPAVPVPAKAMAFVHRGEYLMPAVGKATSKTCRYVLRDYRCIVPKFHIPSEVDERTMRQIEAAAKYKG